MMTFHQARSRSRRSAETAAAGVVGLAALLVCFQSAVSFSQPPAPISRRLALGGAVAGTAVSLTRPAWAEEEAITMDEVLMVQDAWKAAILRISKEYLADPEGQKFKDVALDAAGELYGYDMGDVLFKPTKAKKDPFRVSAQGALSYFVGYNAIKPSGFPEDKGFAINGGKGWKAVSLDNSQITLYGDLAIAQGNYFFTDFDDKTAKVEYSFGYVKNPQGKLKIVLHHSSIPYSR